MRVFHTSFRNGRICLCSYELLFMPIPGEELLRRKRSKGGSFCDKEKMKDPLAYDELLCPGGQARECFLLYSCTIGPAVNGTAKLLSMAAAGGAHIQPTWLVDDYSKEAPSILPLCTKKANLRKQPTFDDATTGFPAKTSEKRAQKFHTNDPSLPRSGSCRVGNLFQQIRSTT